MKFIPLIVNPRVGVNLAAISPIYRKSYCDAEKPLAFQSGPPIAINRVLPTGSVDLSPLKPRPRKLFSKFSQEKCPVKAFLLDGT